MFRSMKISKDRGFLPEEAPLFNLPDSSWNNEFNELMRKLPQLIAEKKVRETLDKLNTTYLLTSAVLELKPKDTNIALLIFSMLANAYLAEAGQSTIESLPAVITNNLKFLRKNQPTMIYADYILNNWWQTDPNEAALTLETIKPIFTFTNSKSEVWFIKMHVMMEAMLAPALVAAAKAADISQYNLNNLDKEQAKFGEILISLLQVMSTSLAKATRLLNAMPREFAAGFFWKTLKPYLVGWDQVTISVLPALDAVLSIQHTMDNTENYLPLEQRKVIAVLQKSRLAEVVTIIGSAKLTAAFDEVKAALRTFRVCHVGGLMKDTTGTAIRELQSEKPNIAIRASL